MPPAPAANDPGLVAALDPSGILPTGPDCSVYPNAMICQLAVQPPESGKPCRGSDAFGITLNDVLPLGSTGKANDINNIYYLYEGAAFSGPGLGGGQVLVGWIAVTQNNWFIISNGRDGNFIHNIVMNLPVLGSAWAAINNTQTGAISPPLTTDQMAAIFKLYPWNGKNGNGTGACFSGPLPQTQWV